MRTTRTRIAAAVVGMLLAGCANDSGGASRTTLRFTDVSRDSGVVLHNVSGSAEKLAVTETLGSGGAAIDYDADGRLDLFLANGDVFDGRATRPTRPALYRNLGGFRFEDVTERAGLAFEGWAHGATRVDFDQDDRPDLYVTLFGRGNRFFRNRGDGTFEDRTEAWGGADPGPSTAAAFFDADADGDLDLYVGNYVVFDPADPPNAGQLCEWRGLRVMCGPQGTLPGADRFYENRSGRLVEATRNFGFADVDPSYALGTVAGDVDGDGDMDLYVANDSEANFLFENLGSGRFREAAVRFGVDRNADGMAQAGMGVAYGDVDGDGRFDLFVTNFSHDSNTLYLNDVTPGGTTLFRDATYAAGLGLTSFPFLSWGVVMEDLDRNGWLDLVIASGHVYPQVDGMNLGTDYAQPNQIFLNGGSRPGGPPQFEIYRPGRDDPFASARVSRGLIAADLDDDGDADFCVVELDEAPTLVRNDSARSRHWVGFVLRGRSPNRDAIGARLVVEDAAGRRQWRERTGGGSYLSCGDGRPRFGLADVGDPLARVEVRWPDGTHRVYRDLAVDRYWRLDAERGEASAVSPPP